MKIGSIELNRSMLASIIVVLVGTVLGIIILTTDRRSSATDAHGESTEDVTYERGPHGGRLFRKGEFAIEVTIYETGVPPVFRVYFYDQDKPVDPSKVSLSADVHRLGPVIDQITFRSEKDYLLSREIIYEPHSFDVKFNVQYKGGSHPFGYSQIEGRTELSPSALKASGIVVETAGPVAMQATLELPGDVVSNADKVAHIVPRLAGVVTEIRKSVGDRVSKGEVIAVVQSRELADLGSAYLAATKRVGLAQTTLVREEALLKKKISAEQDYQQAQQALAEARIEQQSAAQKLNALGITPSHMNGGGKTVLTRYEIRAPLSGTVIERRVAIGEAVRGDTDIFLVADLSTVWVDITVYTRDLKTVRTGQKVTVKSDELGAEASGTVTFISSLVGEQTRSAKARVLLNNPQGVWRPGIFVTVQLVQEETIVPLAVKTSALQKFRDWDVVFIQDGNQFEIRPVKFGRRDREWTEIISGITPGTPYVSENSFVLKADVEKAGASHDH